MPKNKKRDTNRLKSYYVHCQSGVYTVMASSPNKAAQYVFLATGADDFIIKVEKKRD